MSRTCGSEPAAYWHRCVRTMSKKHLASSIHDFLKEEGIFEEAQVQAIKEVVAGQLAEAMSRQKISKNKLATLLRTSRTQVDRTLIRSTTLHSAACNGPLLW